jgi:hypothetical protein
MKMALLLPMIQQTDMKNFDKQNASIEQDKATQRVMVELLVDHYPLRMTVKRKNNLCLAMM